MKIINNTTEKLADDLRVTIKKRSRVSMAAACFSVYAFEELKAQLENLDELRFIFTSPAFLDEKPKKAQREFYIPRLNRERTLQAVSSRLSSAANSASAQSRRNVRIGSGKKPASSPIRPWRE